MKRDEEMSGSEIEALEIAALERRLGLALRRQAAPVGLGTRVMAEARARRQRRQGRMWVLQRALASVVVVAVFAGGMAWREHEERRRAELVREQVMTALRITTRTLDRVETQLNASSDMGDAREQDGER